MQITRKVITDMGWLDLVVEIRALSDSHAQCESFALWECAIEIGIDTLSLSDKERVRARVQELVDDHAQDAWDEHVQAAADKAYSNWRNK